jgi:serine phosphatase RsbU (regulator of sigma subunit)
MSESPYSHPLPWPLRPGWLLLLGSLVFAAGLALALAWLPEWRAGSLPAEKLFLERYRELAGQAGVRLVPGEPRVSLANSRDDLPLAGAAYDRQSPRAVPPQLAGFKVRVEQEATIPGVTGYVLGILFSPDGGPRALDWQQSGFSLFNASSMQLMSRPQIEPFLRPLLAPGETLGPPLEGASDNWRFFYGLPGVRPSQHIAVAAIPGNQLILRRSPGTLGQALARAHRFDLGTILRSSFPTLVLLLLVGGLFFHLVSRRVIDLKNAGLLAAITLVASGGALFHAPPDRASILWTLTSMVGRAFWVFLAWAAGESFIRSSSPDFTTSLDALRVGRLGPRGGRALLSGLGLGAALAGLLLTAEAIALALPRVWPEAPSLRLPIFDTASPPGDGIALAAGALVLLALCHRVLAPRWAIPAAAAVGAVLLAPLDLHPYSAGLLANFSVLLFLFYGGRRFGLTAFLTAAMTAYLLPAAAFSALHLDWLPGTFALTAGDPMALLLLGLLGLKRPEQVELERLIPPAFIRRQEEERRVRYEMDLLSRMQLGLLPEHVPEIPGWQIAVRSLLATEAGGDLYDFLYTGELGAGGHLWIAAGDVAGHGYSCSIVQAMTTAALTSLITPGRTPAEVLREVDRVIRRGGSRRNFTSLALLRLDVTTGEALYANAGHPYPLLLENGEVREIALPGLPLGQGPKREYADLPVTLPPDSVLVFCSDGLFEAADWTGTAYGYERPSEILRWTFRRPAEAILEALLADCRRHLRNADAEDDTTVLVLKRRGR